MSSTRPRRTATSAPILSDCMDQINALKGKYYESITAIFKTTQNYFKDDPYALTNFWMSDTDFYNVTDFKHQYLLRRLFETVSHKHDSIKTYLDTIADTDILSMMGTVRVGPVSKCHYRIRVGIGSDY